MSQEHTERVTGALAEINEDSKALVAAVGEIMTAYGGMLYMMDIYTAGVVKRALALAAGFEKDIQAFNFTCAGALVRLHVDTAIRYAAAWLVQNPNEFVARVLDGTPIRKMKDRDNKLMTDAYLIERVRDKYPWVEDVYDYGCGHVHLSDTHIHSALKVMRDGGQVRFEMEVGCVDFNVPDEVYLNAITAFRATNGLLLDYLRGWHESKSHPELLAAPKNGGGYIA